MIDDIAVDVPNIYQFIYILVTRLAPAQLLGKSFIESKIVPPFTNPRKTLPPEYLSKLKSLC